MIFSLNKFTIIYVDTSSLSYRLSLFHSWIDALFHSIKMHLQSLIFHSQSCSGRSLFSIFHFWFSWNMRLLILEMIPLCLNKINFIIQSDIKLFQSQTTKWISVGVLVKITLTNQFQMLLSVVLTKKIIGCKKYYVYLFIFNFYI